jgi:hypothetical protein
VGAAAKIVGGAALIAAGVTLLAFGQPYGMQVALAGGAVALGGVAEALTPPPRLGAGGARGSSAGQINATIPPELIVYGRCLIPGSPVLVGRHTVTRHNEDDLEFSHVVFVFTRRRPLDGIERVFIDHGTYDLVPNDGQVADFPDDALVPASGKYKDKFALWFRRGDEDPDVDGLPFPWLRLNVPDKWTADSKLTGISAVHCVFEFDPDLWPSGPPEVKFLVRGFLVADPRAPADPPAWSENPALCYADALTGPHAAEGAIDAGMLDGPALIAAANTCDEQLTLKDGTVAPRYRCDGWADSTQDYDAILADILSSMGGSAVVTGDTVKIHAAAPRSVTADHTADDLAAGPVQVQPLRDMRSLSNEVVTLYVDTRAGTWTDATSPAWPPLTSPNPYLDQDNGVRLRRELRQPFVPFTEQVQRLQKIWLVHHRHQLTASMSFLPTAALLDEPVDVVTMTDAYYGWADKKFEIAGYQETDEGAIRLDLVEYDDAIYAWVATEEQTEAAGGGGGMVLVDDNLTTVKNVPVTFDPTANDLPDLAVRVDSFTQPDNGTLEASAITDELIYTPNVDYVGPDSCEYVGTDGVNTATAVISILVANDVGVTAIDDTFTVSDNQPHELDVLFNDLPPTTVKTVDSVTAPSHGTASVKADGSRVIYTRTAGFTGFDAFDYVVSGGGGSDTGSVSVVLGRGGGGGGWGRWNKVGQNTGLRWQSGVGDSGEIKRGGVDVVEQSWANHIQANFPTHQHCDIATAFMTHGSVAGVTATINGKKSHLQTLQNRDVRICQTFPLITVDDQNNFGAALPGGAHRASYVAMWRNFAQVFKDIGAVSPVFRMGHEMNGNHYPWALSSPANYIALYRSAYAEIKDVYPEIVCCWNPLRNNAKSQWWPGDSFVDIVGVDWYNNGSGTVGGFIDTQADWNYMMTRGTTAEPVGFASWIAFANAHGKALCIPEWGEGHGSGTPSTPAQDCPGYVDLMMTWLAGVSPDQFVFETYFNNASHEIDPSTNLIPRFRTAYFDSWSGKPHA